MNIYSPSAGSGRVFESCLLACTLLSRGCATCVRTRTSLVLPAHALDVDPPRIPVAAARGRKARHPWLKNETKQALTGKVRPREG